MKSELNNKCTIDIFPRLVQMESSGNIYLLSDKDNGVLVHKEGNNRGKIGRVKDDLSYWSYSTFTGSVTLSN